MSETVQSLPEQSPPKAATIDPQRQEMARAYAGTRRWLSLANLALGAIFIAVILGFGLHLWLRDALTSAGFADWVPVAGWAPPLVAAYTALLLLANTIVGLPLSVYGGFTLPGRYGMRKQGLGGWVGDQIKGTLLGLVFGVIVVDAIYFLLAISPDLWWVYATVAVLFFSVILANLAPVILLPLFYKLQPMPEGEMRSRLLAMADRAKTHVRGVYVMNLSRTTTEGNAALMGLGNTRRIVVGDTIMDEYTPDEVEVVLAHELGHHVHGDIWKLIITQSVLTLGGVALVNVALHAIVGQSSFGFTGLSDAATIPVIAVLFGVFSFVLDPLTNTISRVIERQADQYALDMTRDPATFISAFNRLANQNLAQLNPHPLIEFLFYNHPSIGRRIRHAETWQASHSS